MVQLVKNLPVMQEDLGSIPGLGRFPDLKVKTSPTNAGGEGLITGCGAEMPHASWQKTKAKQNNVVKHCCKKFNKDF